MYKTDNVMVDSLGLYPYDPGSNHKQGAGIYQLCFIVICDFSCVVWGLVNNVTLVLC